MSHGREAYKEMAAGQKPMISLWARCTTHFRTYLSGDWDVHGGLTDLYVDPWPNEPSFVFVYLMFTRGTGF